MGGFSNNPNPGSGGDIALSLTVDASTGQAVLKNFGPTLQQVKQQWQDTASASDKVNESNKNQALGWVALAAKTALVVEAGERYLDVAKEIFVESTQLAARIDVLNTVMNLTARNMNYSVGQAQAQVQAIRKLNITHKEAIDLNLQFMRSQLQLADASKLTKVAQDLAVVSGQNSSEALDTLTEAIQTNREVLLRQFGIVKTLPMIFEQYASTLGRSASSLTSMERQQAILNTILIEGSKVAGAYDAAMGEAGKRITSLPRLVEDLKEKLGAGLVPVMFALVTTTESVLKVLKAVPAPVYAAIGVFVGLVTVAGTLVFAVKGLAAAWKVLGLAEVAATAASEGLWAVMMANPITALVLAAGALVGIITSLVLWYQNAKKEEAERALALQGEVQQTEKLKDEVVKLIAAKLHLKEVETGKVAPTTVELGSYHYIDQTLQNILAKERLRENTQALEVQAIQAARAATIDLYGVISKNGKTITDMARFQARLADKAAEQKRDAAAALEIQQKQATELRKHADLVATISSEFVKQKYEAAARLGWMSALNKSLIEDSQKAAKAAEDEATAKQKAIDDAKRKNLQGPIVPIDLSQEAAAAKKLQELMSEKEAAERKEVDAGQAFSDRIKQFAQGQVTVFKSQLDNLKSIKEQADSMLRPLQPGEEAALKKFTDATIGALATVTSMTEKGVRSKQDYLKLVQMENAEMTEGAELAGVYGDDVQNADAAATEMLQLQVAAKDKIIAQDAQGFRVQEAKYQAELASLNATSKTADQVERVYRLHVLIAGLQLQLASGSDTWAARIAKIKADGEAAAADLQKAREQTEKLLEIDNYRLAAEKARASVTGASPEVEAARLRAESANAIKAIRNSTKDLDVQDAEVLAKIAQTTAQIALLFRQTGAERASTEDAAISRQIQTMELGQHNAADRAADLLHIADLRTSLATKQADELKENGARSAELAKQGMSQEEALAEIRSEQDKIVADAVKKNYDDAAQSLIDVQEFRNKENAILDHTLLLEGKITPSELQYRDAIREANVQQLELLKNTKLTADQIQRDVDLTKRKAKNAKELSDLQRLPTSSNPKLAAGMQGAADAEKWDASAQAVGTGLDAMTAKMKPTTDAIAVLVAKFDAGNMSFQRFEGHLRDLTQATETFGEMLEHLADGSITKLDLLKGTFDLMGQAASTAFEAIGQGKDAARVMQGFGADILKQLSQFAIKRAVFEFGKGAADLADPTTAYLAPGAFLSGALWMAAGAGLGIAAGAASAGASGGSGGGAGSRAASLTQVAPTGSKTNVDTGQVTLLNGLVVAGREIQAAGTQFTNLGGQLNQFIQAEQEMAASTHTAERQFADKEAQLYQQLVNEGLPQDQLNSFLTNFFQQANQFAAENNQAAAGLMDTTIGAKLDTVATNQTNQANDSTVVLKQIHNELIIANQKNATINLSNQVMIDGGDLDNIVQGGIVKAASKVGAQVAQGVTTAIQGNNSRQALGTALGNGGI